MICKRCKQDLPEIYFKFRGDKPDKLRSWCMECGKKSANKWYCENKEKALATSSKWTKNNKEKVIEAKAKYRETHRVILREKAKKRLLDNPEKEHARLIKIKRTLKQQMIDAYGGKCSCCGEDRFEFLTLEHKNGGGSKHRKEAGSTTNIMRELRDAGWPKENFTVLCMNCNLSKGLYGYCPHEKERGA